MRKWYLIGVGLLLLAILALGAADADVAGAQYTRDQPPDPHAAITEYKGPETCAACHIDTAQEVAESLHYQQQGDVPFREGWERDVLGGMYVTF